MNCRSGNWLTSIAASAHGAEGPGRHCGPAKHPRAPSRRDWCPRVRHARPAGDGVRRWESRTEWSLSVAAVVFLGAFAWPIIQVDLSQPARVVCRDLAVLTWALFIVDYAVRLCLARNWRYFWRHIPDLLAVALPVLRPLRLLRLVTLLRVLNLRATNSLRGRIAIYVGSCTVMVVFCAALAELDAERGHPGANIESFADALWWSCVTMSTVGYGDRYPVTAQGRFVGLGLMLAGIALLGIVTAALASWLIENVREVAEAEQQITRQDISDLHHELQQLRAELRLARGGSPGTDPGAVPVPLMTS